METLRLALSSIIEHRLRALLTALGVVFGVMAVIAVTAIVQGFFRLYSNQLEGLGAGFMMVFPGNSMVEGVRRNTRLSDDDAVAIEAGVPEVLAATPYFFDRRPVSLRGSTAEAVVMPAMETYPLIQNHHVEEGRFFTAREVRERARVVAIGPDLAEKLGLTRAIGEQVRLYGATFTVIGVMENKDGINPLGQNFDDAIIVPHSTALSLTNPNRGGILLVKLKGINDVELVTEQVKRTLRRHRRLKSGEPEDFTITTQAEILKSFQEVSGVAKGRHPTTVPRRGRDARRSGRGDRHRHGRGGRLRRVSGGARISRPLRAAVVGGAGLRLFRRRRRRLRLVSGGAGRTARSDRGPALRVRLDAGSGSFPDISRPSRRIVDPSG